MALPSDPVLNLESRQEPSLIDVQSRYHILLELLMKSHSQAVTETNIQQQSQGQLGGARAAISPTETVRTGIPNFLGWRWVEFYAVFFDNPSVFACLSCGVGCHVHLPFNNYAVSSTNSVMLRLCEARPSD